MMPLFKVTFAKPQRVFYIRAEDAEEAERIAAAVETILEHKHRDRSLDEAIVDALISEDA